MKHIDIVFRARRKDNGEWIEGNYFHNKRKGESHSISQFDDNVSHLIYRDSLQMKSHDNEWYNV